MKIFLFASHFELVSTLEIAHSATIFEARRVAHNECLLIKYELEQGAYEVENIVLADNAWYVLIAPEGTSRQRTTIVPPIADYINIVHLTF